MFSSTSGSETRRWLAAFRRAFQSDPDDLDVRRGLDALDQDELPPAPDMAIEIETKSPPRQREAVESPYQIT